MDAMNIQSLRQAYATQQLYPRQVVKECLQKIRNDTVSNAWIYILSDEQVNQHLQALRWENFDTQPLWGIPFAIKDNIDLAEVPTTAGCPEFAYTPAQHAFVVQQLINAGAIPLGKTNLDQFATGLVGTRSPYGAVANVFNTEYICGGSSAGSAYAVAKGQVSFALGTDTAGSGRIPAAFNNILGAKPTRGLLSCRGVVPACRSLDCVSLFSLCPEDAQTLLKVSAVYDAQDPYSRAEFFAKGLPTSAVKVGIPRASQLEFFGHSEYPMLFDAACRQMQRAGAELIEIDLQSFLDAAQLLYQGPWVAERFHSVGSFIAEHCAAKGIDSTVAAIIGNGNQQSAVDAFAGIYQLQVYKQRADAVLQAVDCILLPTAGQHYTIDAVTASPVELNSNLGRYTNFMNLLDYSALAFPAGFTSEQLPFGVTLLAPAMHDKFLLGVASQFLQEKNWGMGCSAQSMPAALQQENNGYIEVAVCGAHLQGMPLHWQLTERKAKHVMTTTTAPCYEFYALAGGPPYRPGLIRSNQTRGNAIAVEVWAVPTELFGSFVAGIPAPLGIGKVELQNGKWITGFICEPYGIEGAKNITEVGNWRDYIATLK